MKKLVLITILFTIFLTSYGQIGIKAGMNFSNLNYNDIQTDDYSISMIDDKKAGFHFGLFARASLLGIFVQPELLFSTSSNELNVEDVKTGETKIIEQDFNKLDIPVLAGMKFGPFRAGLGPVATIMLSSKSELKDFTEYEEKFNTATFGYQLGIGLDLGPLSADARYEGNLSKFGNGIVVGGEERKFDSRSRQFIVSIGYMF